MKNPQQLINYLLSPIDKKTPLSVKEGCLWCPVQDRPLPQFRSIPWLYPDPEAVMIQWQQRYQFQLAQFQQEIDGLKLEMRKTGLLKSTQKRLQRLVQAKTEHRKASEKLLSPLNLTGGLSIEQHYAAKTRLPESQTLMGYFSNIHRDWSWESQENRICLDLIHESLASNSVIGDCVILGSGACRLAFDIYHSLDPSLMICIDMNPFLLAVAEKMLHGNSLNLYEFPISPINLEATAVKQRLKNPMTKAGSNFYLLLSDALNSCLKPEIMDTVVTPWFIDIVHQDLSSLMQSFNNIIKLGGRWVNFGSLAFFHKSLSDCYSLEEVQDLLSTNGFRLDTLVDRKIPYLDSPYSRQTRFEQVICFTATKISNVPPPPPYQMLPDWVLDPNLPIPCTTEITSMISINEIFNQIANQIDGKKSLNQLTTICSPMLNLSPDQTMQVLQQMFTSIIQGNLKGRHF